MNNPYIIEVLTPMDTTFCHPLHGNLIRSRKEGYIIDGNRDQGLDYQD